MTRNKRAISTKGWSFTSILEYGPNFRPIERVKATSTPDELARAIRRYEDEGIPIIIEGYHEHHQWDDSLFTLDSFQKHSCEDTIDVRNVHTLQDARLPLSDFIEQCRNLPTCATETEEIRMYGKDAECPPIWRKHLEKLLPESLVCNGPNDYLRYRPSNTEVETLMCYLGPGDTYTAAHKDLCASSGHNLMCYTENGGASYWFMTEGSAAPDVAAYFRKLGHELDHETHVITLKELSKAPFVVYVGKQVLGDLVLVPPRSVHQVVNFGGITLKTSWSRMSLKGLGISLYHELPLYQRACRLETYRVKSTIFYALKKQTDELKKRLETKDADQIKAESPSLIEAQLKLHILYNDILSDEWSPSWKSIERVTPDDGGPIQEVDERPCDFCGADLFQSFFECSSSACTPPESDCHYRICPRCYVEGRSCSCQSMKPKQMWYFLSLLTVQDASSKVLEAFGHNVKGLNAGGGEHNSIFAAAYHLQQRRWEPHWELLKVCHLCERKDRQIAIYCSGCHSSKCFHHVLEKARLHASDALVFYTKGAMKDRTAYHQRHSESRLQWTDLVDRVKECQRSGEAPDQDLAPVLRAFVALYHTECRPVHCAKSTAGFYDSIIQDCDVAPESPKRHKVAVESKSESESESPPSPSPSSSSLSSRVQCATSTKRTGKIPTSGLNKKPKLVPYVAVPENPRKAIWAARDASASSSRHKPSASNDSGQHAPTKDKGKQREDTRIGPPAKKPRKRKSGSGEGGPEELAAVLNYAITKNGGLNGEIDSDGTRLSLARRVVKKRKMTNRSASVDINEPGSSKSGMGILDHSASILEKDELLLQEGDFYTPEVPPPLPKKASMSSRRPRKGLAEQEGSPSVPVSSPRPSASAASNSLSPADRYTTPPPSAPPEVILLSSSSPPSPPLKKRPRPQLPIHPRSLTFRPIRPDGGFMPAKNRSKSSSNPKKTSGNRTASRTLTNKQRAHLASSASTALPSRPSGSSLDARSQGGSSSSSQSNMSRPEYPPPSSTRGTSVASGVETPGGLSSHSYSSLFSLS